LEGLQHNHQALSRNDIWQLDEAFDQKWEEPGQLYALLIVQGFKSPSAEDACIDVGIVLSPLDQQKSQWTRVGFFQQYHWSFETYPIFSNASKEEREVYIL